MNADQRPADLQGRIRLLRVVERSEPVLTPSTLKLAGYRVGYEAGRADERLVSAVWIIAGGVAGVVIGAALALLSHADRIAVTVWGVLR